MRSTLNRITIFVLVLLVFSCSFLPRPDKRHKEILLQENLEKWRTFRIDGIIEYNFEQFSFRKNISIRKKDDIARIDVYDSGIFGIKPTPFISIFYDSLLVVRAQDQLEPVIIDPVEYTDLSDQIAIFLNLPELFRFSSKILDEGSLLLNSRYEFDFDEKYRVKEINDLKNDIKTILEYDEELFEINIFKEKEKVADIQIDKINFTVKEIKRLKT